MARPRKDDARTIIYKVRLNESENRMLTEASENTSSAKSEVFRNALKEYHRATDPAYNSSRAGQTETNPDMCVPCADGMINIRVGAIILKDGRFLMVRNHMSDYFYSVGGRIKFGETAEEAVIREVLEETGVKMEIDHLGFIQENYFIADVPSKIGKEIYELGYYFYMKVPDGFEPVCDSITEFGVSEYLEWVSPDEPRTIFPEFFRAELDITDKSVKHRVKDDRFYIRQFTEEDLEPLHELLSDPEIMKYLEHPFTRKQTESFLKTQGLLASPRILAVDDKDHSFIGYVIYHDYDDTSKEIGWILKKEIWGHGMASLLTKQLVAMAASEGKDAVIECVQEQQTTRSLAEKHGFVLVGSREEVALPFPTNFDFEKHLQTSFRMFGTKYTTVDLICANDLMDAILDKFGKDVTTYAYDMENFRVETDVVPGTVFYSWVFGFGGKVVINGPADVKEQYKEMVLKAAERL